MMSAERHGVALVLLHDERLRPREEIADEHDDIVLGKVNVDEEMALAVQFKIASIPTLLVFDGGKQVNKAIGYMPKEGILKLLGK